MKIGGSQEDEGLMDGWEEVNRTPCWNLIGSNHTPIIGNDLSCTY
jgi:hypothetical protein